MVSDKDIDRQTSRFLGTTSSASNPCYCSIHCGSWSLKNYVALPSAHVVFNFTLTLFEGKVGLHPTKKLQLLTVKKLLSSQSSAH
jgi:hypothetical protein